MVIDQIQSIVAKLNQYLENDSTTMKTKALPLLLCLLGISISIQAQLRFDDRIQRHLGEVIATLRAEHGCNSDAGDRVCGWRF